ncbi:Type IV arginine N-methyltransferase [Hyphodiscus hymeniophilus]|uniref:Arginine N-methyltransferase 2 n=1 Tax=Hyphodiscus hymeniophilus TaxID=353542 RepID=A0A9P6VMP3_9HELO|nr:Type IV arginine N-methyltransferase [Hyphodiscus hymeniophilus]
MEDPELSSPEVDLNTQTILLLSSNHDLAALKPLLRQPGNASVQDPETGYTPLHAAIAACGSADDVGEQVQGEEIDMEKAKEVVKELFLSGAIWNDLDVNNETPGCMASRLGRKELYELCVEAGVRAEMLLGLLGGYEPLADEDSEDEEIEEQLDGAEALESKTVPNGENGHADESIEGVGGKKDVNSKDYLKSDLTFQDDKLLDADANGVMMAWETDIMRRTVDLLLPGNQAGKRILNIGFGMGIVDHMFRDTRPLSHHIVEAHPAVIAKLEEEDSDFGKAWAESAPTGGKYIVHKGKWQNVVSKMLEEGEVFDAIYFDTFGEDYSQLKLFFTEYVVGLLDPEGKFGFFNGLGADRRVCYDVYYRVSELDLCDAGMDVEWTMVPVEGLGGEGEREWKGVRRRYWTLDEYRLPICSFMG